MAEEGFERKLAAILSADVEGYSRMMRDDEDSTIRTLTNYRSAMSNLIEKFRGHVVDATGDNLLAEFTSVVDAVNCAVEIQREIAERNAELPDEQKMEFRIGLNSGDVVEEEGKIYGDGVNIAARMEGLAEAGSICISGSVYDSVESRLGLEYEFLGDQKVKNIDKPVRAYRILSFPGAAAHRVVQAKEAVDKKWRKSAIAAGAMVVVLVVAAGIWNYYSRPSFKPAPVEKMALPLPDKPSVAVLPFENMSGDPEQEYFSDGIAENIITALSKVGELFVIARNSSFSYKGKPVKVQQISSELGVRYVLEGSVRRSGDKVRITAQLIDAKNGQHLWAENYDRSLKDIFAVQDEITVKIITAMRVKLSEGEQARMWAKRIKRPDVHLKQMEALSLWRKGTKEGFIRFGQLAQEIIDMAPDLPAGYKSRGWYYWSLAYMGTSPRENLKKALELAQKAISLDESDSMSHSLLGSIYLFMRKYDKAIESGKRAVELEPNGASVSAILGLSLSYATHTDDAIAHFKKAIRLNPFPPYWYYSGLGDCYIRKEQYEDALTEYKKATQRSPDALHNNLGLVAVYVSLDRQEEAEAAVRKVLEIDPNFSTGSASNYWPYKNPADRKIIVDALLKAGLPE